MTDAVRDAVRERLEAAEIHTEPFPHLVCPDLLPPDVFGRLADTVPPLDAFEPSQRGIKADMPLGEKNPYFAAAPDDFRSTWSSFRDDVMQGTVAPLLARRFEDGIRAKYTELFNAEIAERILADGLVGSDGRLMSRKPGYWLKPHLDSAHFAVTCLLYFSQGPDRTSGALCLFTPDHQPEVRDVSTYYPEKEEGVVVELAKEIPIRENMFIAFLNVTNALHGVRIDKDGDTSEPRLTYQSHVLPRTDIRKDVPTFLDELPEAARARWQKYVARAAEKTTQPA